MKKKSVINLIKYHAENNDAGFRSEAYEIARYFDQAGDYQLAEYIMALMSNANTFIPQMSENESAMFEKVEKLEKRYQELGIILSDPNVIQDYEKFRDLSRQRKTMDKAI